jgi:Putative prokaryotic signal transducing protein
MDRLKWKVVSETNSRLEAEFIKSYFEAQGIEVELVQESIGHTIYPVTVDGLGRVQIFVPEEKIVEAKGLLKAYLENSKGPEV